MSIYEEHGYDSRREYLEELAAEYGQPLENVLEMAFLLGEDEDFDGLVSALEEV